MCIILPVDHIPCTHTVAIWQHCIKAPRSKAYGLSPCSRIRQHARPILTRKLCINCGGPRFFARRGGIAERGRLNELVIHDKADEEQWEANDSGYHSDAILEEDEDDIESTVSPRTSRLPVRAFRIRDSDRENDSRSSSRTLRSHQSRSRSRSRTPSRRSSWRPNLKHELTGGLSTFYRPESINSEVSSYMDSENGRMGHSHSRSLDSLPSSLDLTRPAQRVQLHALDTTAPHPTNPARKDSTLLHPSTPSMEPLPETTTVSPIDLTLHLEDTTSQSARKTSTLLHPSTPAETSTALECAPNFPFPASPPTSNFSIPRTTSQRLQRPELPRKNSSLLHPSTPDEPATLNITEYPFSQPLTPPSSSHSSTTASPGFIFALSPYSSNTSSPSFLVTPSPKVRESVIHSSHSDVEWDSGSEYSDQESDDTKSYHHSDREDNVVKASTVVLATTARIARASRIEFHGANWRVLETNGSTAVSHSRSLTA